jgi:hypothetical protein
MLHSHIGIREISIIVLGNNVFMMLVISTLLLIDFFNEINDNINFLMENWTLHLSEVVFLMP